MHSEKYSTRDLFPKTISLSLYSLILPSLSVSIFPLNQELLLSRENVKNYTDVSLLMSLCPSLQIDPVQFVRIQIWPSLRGLMSRSLSISNHPFTHLHNTHRHTFVFVNPPPPLSVQIVADRIPEKPRNWESRKTRPRIGKYKNLFSQMDHGIVKLLAIFCAIIIASAMWLSVVLNPLGPRKIMKVVMMRSLVS